MKLIRFGKAGKEKPGVLLEDGVRLDVSAFGSDYNEDFFAGNGLSPLARWLEKNCSSAPRIDQGLRLGQFQLEILVQELSEAHRWINGN